MTFRSEGTRRRGMLTAYAPLFIWIALIFFMSSDQGSMPATSRFIRPLLEFFFPASSEDTLQFYHFLIRKAAHFSAYALLGLLAARALLFSNSSRRWPCLTFAIVLIVASLDELNQSFSSARSGSPYDVLIDCVGGLFAIAAVWLYMRNGTKGANTLPA
ncbi:MAG: VanZ family protein [Pyrinomonadaceae bacterium]